MYRFHAEQVRDERFLTELITKFKSNDIPRFRKLQEYYDVQTEILQRTMDPGKPNNKLAHGFARYIANMATSFFMGKPVKYEVPDETVPAEDGEGEKVLDHSEYEDILNKELSGNYIHKLNYDVAKECSKKGIGQYLLFLDEEGSLRIKKCDAESIIPVYSPKLGEFLECAVRLWEDRKLDGTLIAEYAAVYDKEYIRYYRRRSACGTYQYYMREPHMMSDIPVIVNWNNEEQMGDYEPVIPLIDAYDKAQSDTGNDMDYFSDAYLCIAGAAEITDSAGNGEGNDAEHAAEVLRKNKILYLDEKGQAEWLTKNINDTASENYKNRVYNDLFFLAQVPALSDESFAGNLTGVAIKYKLIGLEELAIMKQNAMDASQKKLVSLVTDYINLKYNKDFDPKKVVLKYERNLITNDAELIDNAAKLENITSHETQLSVLPSAIVQNAKDELDRIQQEMAEAEGIPLISDEEI